MVKIPKAVDELNESIARSKHMLARLAKGQEIIEKAYADKSIARIFEAAILFNKIAMDLNEELEHGLFMHECAATGRTVLINRKGKPVNIDDFVSGEDVPVDLWTLKSMNALKDTFGENAIVDVEFK